MFMKRKRKIFFVFSAAVQLISYCGAVIMLLKKKKQAAGFFLFVGILGTIAGMALLDYGKESGACIKHVGKRKKEEKKEKDKNVEDTSDSLGNLSNIGNMPLQDVSEKEERQEYSELEKEPEIKKEADVNKSVSDISEELESISKAIEILKKAAESSGGEEFDDIRGELETTLSDKK